jgi:ketosteroid isomerase-like protein
VRFGVLQRLVHAMNAHDADAVAEVFDPDYHSEQPAHPARSLSGREQIRRNWTDVFQGVPDFRAELVRSVDEGDTSWAEWHWHGTHSGGSPFEMRGVTILIVRQGTIASGRLYMEPVEAQTERIAEGVRRLFSSPMHDGRSQ